MTDQASCPRSSGSDPQTVISDTVVLSAGTVKVKAAAYLAPHSPTYRHNPFNEDSDTNTTNTSADGTPVHVASRYYSTTAGDDTESTSNELEVIRYSSYSFSFWLEGSYSIRTAHLIVLKQRGTTANHSGLPGWPDEGNQPRSAEGRAPQILSAASITRSPLSTWKRTTASWPRRM